MKHTSIIGIGLTLCLAAVTVPALAGRPDAAVDGTEAAAKITIALKQQNRSGQSGTATLIKRKDGTFTVLIRMSRPAKFPGPSQNAHIHNVTCAKYARMKSFNARLATVVDGLPNLRRGRSTAHVSVSLAKRTTGRFAINVHEQNAPYTVVACGDIPRR
jgi:hypothetical protein